MTGLESRLFDELKRTIKLLGGQEDILGSLEALDNGLPQSEAVDETLRLVKCWNDDVEKFVFTIPENPIYKNEKFRKHVCV